MNEGTIVAIICCALLVPITLSILAIVLRWIFQVPTRTKQNAEIVRLLNEINKKMSEK